MCEIAKDRKDRVLVKTWRHILLLCHILIHTTTLLEQTCGFDTWLGVYGRGPRIPQFPAKTSLQKKDSHIGGDKLRALDWK